jgi:hypothetical protein
MVAVKVTTWLTVAEAALELTVVAVGSVATACVSALDALVVKLVSPLYVATTDCATAAGNETVQVAVPVAEVSGCPVQRAAAVVVSVKVTVPVGLTDPANAGVTTAEKVTDWLTLELAGTDMRAVVVAVELTASDNAVEVALPKFELELVKAAVTRCAPGEVKAAAQAGTVPLLVKVTVQRVALAVVSL